MAFVSKCGRRHGVLILAAALAAMALSACSTAAPTFQESPNGQIIAVSTFDSDVREEALFQGTVGWGDAGCMMNVEGPQPELIVFPKGTTIDDNDEIELPNGFRFQAGDEVGLGGGVHSADPASETLSALPEGCVTDDIFYASGEVAE